MVILTKPAAVFANERFLAVHVKDGGPVKVHLPRRYARIVNLLTDETVAENTDFFTVSLASPDTQMFGLE